MAESIPSNFTSGTVGGSDVGPEPVRTALAGRRREDRVVGASQATRDAIAAATAAAKTELPVVLVAPEGGDKELLARAMHSWGPRAAAPFEALSCAAVPEALQPRELFGCEEGVYPAIPGAYAGALERCRGGTLFLDQVEALSSTTFGQLLEVLRTKSYRREGASSNQGLETRIVCALPRESDRVARLGELQHHTVTLLPLAERPEDILPLGAHYLRAFSEDAGLEAVGFTADARASLLAEPWTGDALELRERIRQAIRLAGQGAISAEALMLARDAEDVPSFKEAKRAFETRYVVGLLRRCSGNISRAARLAKKDRKDFYDVIRRTGVNPADFR